jgi:hypothetical protein
MGNSYSPLAPVRVGLDASFPTPSIQSQLNPPLQPQTPNPSVKLCSETDRGHNRGCHRTDGTWLDRE